MGERRQAARSGRAAALVRAALASVVMAAGACALAADPTLDQVYEAVHTGRLDQAQRMMAEVLHDHPNSAKAHYVEAEVLARQGRADQAQAELSRAEQLSPGLPFASSASVRQLWSLIAPAGVHEAPIATADPSATMRSARESSFPWGLLAIVVVGGLIIYAIVRPRRGEAAVPYGGGSGASAPPPVAASAGAPAPGALFPYSGAAMAPPASGLASNIVGSLASGAAVGAGVVAGEALAHELIGGHDSSRDLPRNAVSSAPADNDSGGRDFGVSDAGSWDDADSGQEGDADSWN
jgi:uncharacterized protein